MNTGLDNTRNQENAVYDRARYRCWKGWRRCKRPGMYIGPPAPGCTIWFTK